MGRGKYHGRANALRPRVGEHQGRTGLGRGYDAKRQETQSEVDLKFALQMANSYPNHGVNVLALRLHPQERIRWLKTALTAARLMKDLNSESEHLDNLGLAYAIWVMPVRPSNTTIRRWPSAARSATDRDEGDRLGNMGMAYANLGEVRKAIEYYDQALAIGREIGEAGRRSRSGKPGHCLYHLGEIHKAIEYYDQPGHQPSDWRYAGGRSRSMQHGLGLRGSGRGAQGHRVL